MNHLHDDSDFLKTLTLLYVEDDPDTCAQLAKFLRQRVAALITAAGGADGLDAYQTHRPAIVITDIQMPGLLRWRVNRDGGVFSGFFCR